MFWLQSRCRSTPSRGRTSSAGLQWGPYRWWLRIGSRCTRGSWRWLVGSTWRLRGLKNTVTIWKWEWLMINEWGSLNSITSEWFNNLSELRKELKDNRLLKLLNSPVGTIWTPTTIYINHWNRLKGEGLNICKSDKYDHQILKCFDYGDREYYKSLSTKSPYKYNIRLKPWITAMARNLTAREYIYQRKTLPLGKTITLSTRFASSASTNLFSCK